ncbi:MAG: hypothetical protein R3B06_30275 [Kofleriaceae bacterium]
MRRAALLALLLAACGSRKQPPPPTDDTTTGRLVGIYPEQWGCEVVATVASLGEVLGGPVRQVEGSLAPPRGTPKPCNYLLEVDPPQPWSFDLDCRADALHTAEIIWQQQLAQNQALVAAAADAGDAERTDDAGVVHAVPAGAVEVAVGARGLDVSGQALLFIDDDSPCYGRVVGPDAARRLALAQLIATHLRPATAPMEPRAAGK